MNNEHSEQIHAFLHSYDFMKLGQAINKNQWQIAAMTIQRMTKQAKELGLDAFDRSFTGLRQAINRREATGAKQALAVVISKRVKLIGEEKNSLCSDDKDR